MRDAGSPVRHKGYQLPSLEIPLTLLEADGPAERGILGFADACEMIDERGPKQLSGLRARAGSSRSLDEIPRQARGSGRDLVRAAACDWFGVEGEVALETVEAGGEHEGER